MAQNASEILTRVTGRDPDDDLIAGPPEPSSTATSALDSATKRPVSFEGSNLFSPLAIQEAQFMRNLAAASGPDDDPDRSVLGELGVGVLRAGPRAKQQLAGLVEGFATQFTGLPNVGPVARLIQTFAQVTSIQAEFDIAQLPPSVEERGFSLRKTAGGVGEAAPLFAAQMGAAMATRGRSLPVQLSAFAFTAAGPSAGGQYLETLAETGDPDQAAVEAGANGIIVLGLSYFSGFLIFKTVKPAQKFLVDAALRVAGRMGGGAFGESFEELGEAVLMEAVESMVRTGDLDSFKRILASDPEFWTETFNNVLVGAVLGGAGGGAAGSAEVAARLKAIGEITQVDDATLQEAHEILLLQEQQRIDDKIAEDLKRAADVTPGKIPVEFVGPQEQVPPKPPIDLVNLPSGDTVPFDPELHEIVKDVSGEPGIEVISEDRAKAREEAEAQFGVVGTPTTPAQFATAQTRPPEWSPNPDDFPIHAAAVQAQADIKATALTQKTPSQNIRAAISEVIGVVANVATERREANQVVNDELNRIRGEALRAKKITKGLQDTAVKLVRAVFKGKGQVPKPLLKAVANARTPLQFAKAMRTVGIELGKVRRRDAVARLKATLKKAQPNRLGPDLRDAVQTLMDGLRFGKLSPAMTAQLEALRALVAEQPDVGLSETVQKRIAQLDKIAVQSLSAEEVTALADALETIIEIATKRTKRSRAARAQEEQTLASQMAAEIGGLRKGKGFAQGRARLLRTKGFQLALGGVVRNIFGVIENSDLDFIGEILGGGEDSASWNAIHQDGDDAQSEGFAFFFQEKDALIAFLKTQKIEIGSQELSDMSADLVGVLRPIGTALSAIGVDSPGLRKPAKLHEVTLKNGEVLRMTSDDRMGIMLGLTDNETLDKVVFKGVRTRLRGERKGTSRRLHLEDVRAIADSMPEVEHAIVRFISQRFNGPMKQKTSEHSIERRGYDITKPDTWAPRHRVLETAPAPATAANIETTFHAQIGLEPSIVKKRGQDDESPIEFRGAFAEHNNVAWATAMYTAQEPWMSRVRRVLKHRDVQRALEGSRVQRAEDGINEILNQIAREITGAPADRGLIEGNFRRLVRNIPKALLGFSPRIALYQVVSTMVAGAEMPRGYIARALRLPFTDKTVDERMNTVPYLRWRFESSILGIVSDVLQLSQDVLGFKPAGELPMMLIRFMDRRAIRVIFRAVEMEVGDMVADGRITQDQYIEVRDRRVRQVVTRTQPTFDAMHVPVRAVEAKRKVLLKATNLFRSMRNKLVIMENRSWFRMARKPTRKVIREEMTNLSTTMVLNAIAIASIRNAVTAASLFAAARGITGNLTDEDREKLEELPRKLAASFLRTLIGVRWLGDWVAEGVIQVLMPDERVFDPELTPVEGLAAEGIRSIGKAMTGLEEGDVGKVFDAGFDALAVVGATEGIPLPFIKREIDNLIDELEAEDSDALGRTR